MLDMPFRTAKQLAAAIRTKKIGCLELLDLYLARVEAYNPELNADHRHRHRGRAQARQGGRRARSRPARSWGPLHGVPMTIKESYDVAGLPDDLGRPGLQGQHRPRRTRWRRSA